MINYNQLYYFFVTARAGSVTAAAKELRVAQPSLSSQLKTLEANIGKKLFEREGRGIRLSSDGEFVYGHCRKIYDAAESFERELLEGGIAQSRLRIGVVNELDRTFTVDLVSRMHRSKSTKKVHRIEMSSEGHEKLSMLLRSGAIDALITHQPVFDPDFQTLASAKMPVVLAYNSEGRFKKLASHQGASLRTLVREFGLVWSLPKGTLRLRKEIDLFLEKQKLKPDVVFESDVVATLVRAVADDVGVAFLPRPYLRLTGEKQPIRTLGPNEGFWSHGIWLIARKKKSEAVEIESLKEAFRASLALGIKPSKH